MPPIKPAMTEPEMGFLNRYLADCQGPYFEFGCGGSTYYASLYRQIQPITSVESSQEWIKFVSNLPLVNQLIQQRVLKFIYIDINADNHHLGYPKDDSKKELWPEYSRSILTVSPYQKPKMVLIDGRFRVACALHTLSMIETETPVLIHDYRDRPHYHCLTQFYTIVDRCETFVALKKKDNRGGDTSQVEKMIKTYELDPR